jgi:hypothetical protein
MHPLPFGGEEGVRRRRRRRSSLAERMGDVPDTVIEPRPRVGRADRPDAEEALDCPLEPNRRRMLGADAGDTAVRARIG